MSTTPPAVSDPRNAIIAGDWRKVNFATDNVSPPTPLYVSTEDYLYFNAVISTTIIAWLIDFEVRFLRTDGTIITLRLRLNPFTPVAGHYLNPGEGFILSVTASWASAVALTRGQVFVQTWVVRNITTDPVFGWALISDYLTFNYTPTWPGNQLKTPTEGPGFIRSVQVAAPGPGADILTVVPAGKRWRPISVKAGLTTSAAVASRVPQFFLDDGANQFYFVQSLDSQAASLSATYVFSTAAVQTTVAIGTVQNPLPQNCVLPAGYRLGTATVAIQAADQWTAAQLLVEEWMDF